MRFEMHTDTDGDRITVEAGDDSVAADGQVEIIAPATERHPHTEEMEPLSLEEQREYAAVLSMPPAQARELAAALLRAADEADWSAGVNTYPDVPAGELRVGDVLRPSVDYRGDDNDETAVCAAVMKRIDAPYLRVTWRDPAGETWTSTMHERESVCLMRRGPEEH
jgi:hypothetical protein